MGELLEDFLQASEAKVFDADHKRKINFNVEQYTEKVDDSVQQYDNLKLARKRASNIKSKVIENLEKYLIEFEANFIKRGGKIIWAQDEEEAVKEIKQLLEKAKARTVVKSKSMVTEEIHLNDALKQEGIESIETDLGEYIQQLSDEPPYHIVTPAMHKSKEDIAQLFNEKFNTSAEATPEDLTAFVRQQMRDKFINADVGITGANFLIADIGAVAITENEGNAAMSVTYPKIHIAVAGVEKLIPSITDLDLFWSLLSTFGTGQNITTYNSIVSGPRQPGEKDGPEEMYVVLLDNGRSQLLEAKEQRRALTCIKCGACLNVCPVYKNIGGHAYGTTYTGPIGSVIMPHLKGMEEYKHFSYASTLCGKCTEVCPVNIDIHKLLLYNRRDLIKGGSATKSENWMWFFWKGAMLKRSKMEKGGAKLKNFMLKQFFKKPWGERRELPAVTQKSFNQVWRERMKIK